MKVMRRQRAQECQLMVSRRMRAHSGLGFLDRSGVANLARVEVAYFAPKPAEA
jgi:hypothetical protein